MSTAVAATLDANAVFDDLSTEEKFRFARRVSLAASIGTAIEFYDFFIYATAAALVFRTQFFPNLDPVTGTAVSIATFAAGYLSRPVGAAVLANLGDKYGRKRSADHFHDDDGHRDIPDRMPAHGGDNRAGGAHPAHSPSRHPRRRRRRRAKRRHCDGDGVRSAQIARGVRRPRLVRRR